MSYISEQYAYAKAQGWLPFFQTAGKDYEFEPSLLMAIGSRETNLKNIVGDYRGGIYHGYGLMQADIGSFPDFCKSGQWKNAARAIQKGAQILDDKRTEIEHGQGEHLLLGSHSFVGAHVPDSATLIRIAVAAYNTGLNAYYAFSTGRDPDAFTTNHDYSRDVLARQVQFAALLKADGAPPAPRPTPAPVIPPAPVPAIDVSTPAGIWAAMVTLGYGDAATSAQLIRYVRLFQQRAGLPQTGQGDPATQAALTKALASTKAHAA